MTLCTLLDLTVQNTVASNLSGGNVSPVAGALLGIVTGYRNSSIRTAQTPTVAHTGAGAVTLAKKHDGTSDASLNEVGVGLWVSQMGANPGGAGYAASWNGSSFQRVVAALQITGHDPVTPVGATGSSSQAGSSGTSETTSLSGSPASDSMVIAATIVQSTAANKTTSSGFDTELIDLNITGAQPWLYVQSKIGSPPSSVTRANIDSNQPRSQIIVEIRAADPPVATNDSFTGLQQTVGAYLNVLTNDTAASYPLAPASVAIVSGPTGGTAVPQADGTILYTPNGGTTSDSFTYTVADTQGNASNTATVSITATASLTPPTANNDSYPNLIQGQATILPVLQNDLPGTSPIDTDTVAIVAAPTHGTAQTRPDGTISYTPNAGTTADSFTYTVDGEDGATSAAATVSITARTAAQADAGSATGLCNLNWPVIFTTLGGDDDVVAPPMPDAPTATADAFNITYQTTTTLAVLTNDVAGINPIAPATVVVETPAISGTAVAQGDGTILYTPNTGFSGADSFTYSVADTAGIRSGAATVSLTVFEPPVVHANGYALRARHRVPTRAVPNGTTCAGFLIYVDITHASLKTVGNGGSVQHASAYDLRWEKPDGTKLPHRTVKYDGVAGRWKGYVRDTVGGVETQRFLYIGKTGLSSTEEDAVALYVDCWGVWNCKTGVDLTGAGRNLTPTSVAAGEILGEAGSFDGSTSALHAALTGFGGGGGLTIQALLQADATALGTNRGWFKKGASGDAPGACAATAYWTATAVGGTVPQPIRADIKVSGAGGAAWMVSGASQQSSGVEWASVAWASGSAPVASRNGIPVTAGSSQAGSGTVVDVAQDLWIGAGPTNATYPTAGPWKGLIEEVRVRNAGLPADWLRAEGDNFKEPEMFAGISSFDGPAPANQSPVAMPMRVSTNKNTLIFVDVIAASYEPDAQAMTITDAGSPSHGTAAVVSGKIRYTPTTNYTGTDSFIYTISDGAKTSTAKVIVTVLDTATTSWAGPKSLLAWHSGAVIRHARLESVRTHPTSGKLRGEDVASQFLNGGTTWSEYAASAGTWADGADFHSRVVAGAGMNIAFRPFSTKVGTIPANYNSISSSQCCSPMRPVGFSVSVTNVDDQKDLAMACWQAAADGKFDALWTNSISALRVAYDARLIASGRAAGVTGLRVIIRGFWEANSYMEWGTIQGIRSASFACARNLSEAGVCKAAMKRFCQVARTAWPGCFLHFAPLRGGQHWGDIREYIDVSSDGWDIIGPDYYDHSRAEANAAGATASQQLARWNAQATEEQSSGPKGIIKWGNWVRTTGKLFGIGEWGLWPYEADLQYPKSTRQNGGGDNPVFIQKMFQMFSKGPVGGTTSIDTDSGFADIMAYETYFNYYGTAVENSMIAIGGSPASPYPLASAAARALWGTLV